MANIGTFKKVGEQYQGEILTLTLQTNNVRIVTEDNRNNEKAPTHRVYVGRAEIGAAWPKTSKDGSVDYLSIKLDDPSLAAPIHASLLTADDGETYNLVWNRPRSQNAN